LETFYPTSTLITGFDILFFWVARMMMMGLRFMGDVPFKEVYIHALVRDFKGQKMSKSRGNVIDPLVMMERYGTDAFRFTLAALAAQGRDIILAEERIEGYRHFANKIWNASRFCLMNLKGWRPSSKRLTPRTLPDRWVLDRLNQVIREETEALETYRFNDAAQSIYQFVWHQFCDWYLEMIKPTLYGDEEESEVDSTRAVMSYALEMLLRLLHPFMPFITEEIWQRMPWTDGSIMVIGFPRPDESLEDAPAVHEMEWVMSAIDAIRNIRGELSILPSKHLPAIVVPNGSDGLEALKRNRILIETLARVSPLDITLDHAPPKRAVTAVMGTLEVFIPLDEVRFIEEKCRIEKEIQKIEKDLGFVKGKLSNKAFLAHAPPEVVEKQRAKASELEKVKQRFEEGLQRLLGD
jgi:valyl-tRNA synthetase